MGEIIVPLQSAVTIWLPAGPTAFRFTTTFASKTSCVSLVPPPSAPRVDPIFSSSVFVPLHACVTVAA
ncbi:MAG: hypothetical protein ACRELY_26155, partial [Polyangiaceae bacterium]